MNVISYSLFKDCPEYLYNFYEDGMFYNYRMAKLLFPEWQFMIHHSWTTSPAMPFSFRQTAPAPRCESMLWRLKPIWMEGVERVICRDLDSLLTYRDMKSVERWIASGKSAHGMNDNPAHGGLPLMGGMCGFKSEAIKKHFPTWESLIEGFDLSQHGSDQELLMKRVYPIVQNDIYFDQHPEHYPFTGLAESDLCVRHIGSAGINEMETLRFLHKYEKQ